MISCKEMKELSTQYIDNMLGELLRKQADEHLALCESCRNELAELICIIESCNSLDEVDLPANFKEKLHFKLINEINTEKPSHKLPGFFGKYIKIGSTIAAGLFLVIALRDVWSNLTLPSMGSKAEKSSEAKHNMALKEDGNKGSNRSGDTQITTNMEAADTSSKIQNGTADFFTGSGQDAIADSTKLAKEKAQEQVAQNFSATYSGKQESAIGGTSRDSSTGQMKQNSETSDRQGTASRTEDMVRSEELEDVNPSSQTEETKTLFGKNPENIKSTASTALTSMNTSESKNTSVTIKANNIDQTITTLKTVSSGVGATVEFPAPLEQKMLSTSESTSGNKTLNIKVSNSEFEKFKDLVTSSIGSDNLKFGEMVTKDLSNELNEQNKKLDEINKKIFEIEIKSSTPNFQELEKLKKERNNALANLEKLNSEAQYTNVTITISGN